MQGEFLECAEILPTRLFDGVEGWRRLKRIVAQKIHVFLFFDIEFFRYFFRVLREASGSLLEYLYGFQ
jgi:hypothetical protein